MGCSASLVIYNYQLEFFLPAINSFLVSFSDGVLVISDNSIEPLEDELLNNPRIKYIFNHANLGFGTAHNRAIAAIDWESDFHLILNPDITFEPNVIPWLIGLFHSNPAIGAIMPRINYPDGTLQRLCKLLPTPVDLILRRFVPIRSVQIAINNRYEMYDLPQDCLVDVPTISGCFLIVRTELFRRIGGFDERFFMYLEDVDLVRRIGDIARVVYEPKVCVTHAYAKGSYRNKTLLAYHILSALRYFGKWGWFWDPVRADRNRRTLNKIKALNSFF